MADGNPVRLRLISWQFTGSATCSSLQAELEGTFGAQRTKVIASSVPNALYLRFLIQVRQGSGINVSYKYDDLVSSEV